MSPRRGTSCRGGRCFPRVSGDEPLTAEDRQAALKFSPRERG